MSIIIRPSTGVFRRTLPLVLVFGAYDPAPDTALDDPDIETIVEVVRFARNLQAPIAFLRQVCSDDSFMSHGRWLAGCRPKTSDRVFDHAPGSAFENREFLSVFRKITEREILAAGPRNDSSLRETLRDKRAAKRLINRVIPDHPLQKCSTNAGLGPWVLRTSSARSAGLDIPLSIWRHSVCQNHKSEDILNEKIKNDIAED